MHTLHNLKLRCCVMLALSPLPTYKCLRTEMLLNSSFLCNEVMLRSKCVRHRIKMGLGTVWAPSSGQTVCTFSLCVCVWLCVLVCVCVSVCVCVVVCVCGGGGGVGRDNFLTGICRQKTNSTIPGHKPGLNINRGSLK